MTMTKTEKPAVILLSGGLDSATALAIARTNGYTPYALSFRYGQRHSIELDAAQRVAAAQDVTRHVIADIDLRTFGGSALTDDIDVPHHDTAGQLDDSIPITYVPARNTMFLSFALAWAETLGATDIFIGVNALDYSGYPDCRPEYIAAFEQMANLATKAGVEGQQLRIHTPLIHLTKSQIISRGLALGVDYSLTHSLLRPRHPGTCMRNMRLLPAPPQRLHRTWNGGPMYRVKEIFYTLQGEGTHAGRPAVFCRFTSCNLWTGREKDRHRAICQFCDTDFLGTGGSGGGRFETPQALATAVQATWPRTVSERAQPFVVCTGGEPLLQLGQAAVQAMQAAGFEVAVETNGTQDAPPALDWICVSPKAGAPLSLTHGDELKLVYPQENAPPEMFEELGFPRLYLQPMDGPDQEKNTALAVDYCLAHPQWRLSLQTHKYLGIP